VKCPGSIAEWTERMIALPRMAVPARSVPCGSCNACCRHAHLHADLTPDERAEFPEAVLVPGTGWALPKMANGECVYFTGEGCGIYDRRPISCRVYDCRTTLFGFHKPSVHMLDLLQEQAAMWGEWTVETPEDVDHLLAWTRAASEAYTSPTTPTYSDMLADLVKRYRAYFSEALEVRESIGFDAARELALKADKAWRAILTRTWEQARQLDDALNKQSMPAATALTALATGITGKGKTPPIELGAAVNAIAERIKAKVGKIVPGEWAFTDMLAMGRG